MELRTALKRQYHSGLSMLKQAIERCPEELWAARDHPRSYWRIVYHTLFYTHLYLHQTEGDFIRWHQHQGGNPSLASDPWPPGTGPKPYTKAETLEYWAICDAFVDPGVDSLDLDAPSCGFYWYDMTKLEHQFVNL